MRYRASITSPRGIVECRDIDACDLIDAYRIAHIGQPAGARYSVKPIDLSSYSADWIADSWVEPPVIAAPRKLVLPKERRESEFGEFA